MRDLTPCVCSVDQVSRYRARLSGPLLDRIDIHVGVEQVAFKHLFSGSKEEASSVVAARVLRARELQAARQGLGIPNASLSTEQLFEVVRKSEKLKFRVSEIMQEHRLSARAMGRILKVARTIADLRDVRDLDIRDLNEAMAFRLVDQVPVDNLSGR